MTDSEKLDQILKGLEELRTDVREIKIRLAHTGQSLLDIIHRLAAAEVRAEMDRENAR